MPRDGEVGSAFGRQGVVREIGEAMSEKKRGGSRTSSSAGKAFKKEQAEATAAGSKLVAVLDEEKKARAELQETVAQDTKIIAAMDKELGMTQAALADHEGRSKKNLAKLQAEWESTYKRQEQELTEAKKRAHDIGRRHEAEMKRSLALEKHLQMVKDDGEQAELIERLKAEAKESRALAEAHEAASFEMRDSLILEKSKKAVEGADPDVLVLLQSLIKGNPNCDTSEGGIMHKQCKRGAPCLFRRARQMLRAHGMEIR